MADQSASDKPTIIITHQPEWADWLTEHVGAAFDIQCVKQPGTYMATLIDSAAALVLVDGAADDWSQWTTIPKTSNATRRIPIALISDDAEARASSALKGADIAFAVAEFRQQIDHIVSDYARVMDVATQEQLDCECREPLPELARQGVARFNAGEYYKQHDLFEELWMQTSGPIRDLYRAILQVGIGYYQIERGNYRGALKMLQRSVQWLVLLPDQCQGIDVARLKRDSFAVRAELECLGEARFADFDHALIQKVHFVDED
ncbi:MAG: DUF309 domain-containing protein [Anaerolineaceae bacterium]|nr:DUF309 domain-containing protein [Anaerolineaceae bacterium]